MSVKVGRSKQRETQPELMMTKVIYLSIKTRDSTIRADNNKHFKIIDKNVHNRYYCIRYFILFTEIHLHVSAKKRRKT